MRLARRRHDFLLGGFEPAVADVVQQAAVEQVRILRNQAQLRVQRFLRQRADVCAVHQYLPRLRIVEPQDQAHERGLAGAGVAHQADALPGGNGDAQPAEDRLIRRIGEGDVAKFDPALFDLHSSGARLIDDLVRPDDGVHAVGDVAEVLEELEEAPAQVARLVDDEQGGGRCHHELGDRDLIALPESQREPQHADLQHRRGRVLKPAHPLRIPARLALRPQLPPQLLVEKFTFEPKTREQPGAREIRDGVDDFAGRLAAHRRCLDGIRPRTRREPERNSDEEHRPDTDQFGQLPVRRGEQHDRQRERDGRRPEVKNDTPQCLRHAHGGFAYPVRQCAGKVVREIAM